MPLPAISLVAVPGRRRLTIELAQEIERRGFAGIYSPVDVRQHVAVRVPGVEHRDHPVRHRHRADLCAHPAATSRKAPPFMHEVSGGRFRLGIGVAHGPSHHAHGRDARQASRRHAQLRRTVSRAGGPRAHCRRSSSLRCARRWWRWRERSPGRGVRQRLAVAHGGVASRTAGGKRNDPEFFIGNMLPTCISDDVEAAKAVCRRTLTNYVFLPNYRNYWKEAGYVEEMTAIEQAIADGRRDDVPKYLTDKWLADNIAVRAGRASARRRRGMAGGRRAHAGDRAVVRRGRISSRHWRRSSRHSHEAKHPCPSPEAISRRPRRTRAEKACAALVMTSLAAAIIRRVRDSSGSAIAARDARLLARRQPAAITAAHVPQRRPG